MKTKPTSREYSEAVQRMEKISSANSKSILEFFINYDNGFFLPEKCDAYEPIREKFDTHNLNPPLRWLSQPGSALYLKKIKPYKFEGVIENERIAPIWEDRDSPLSLSAIDPYYLSYIWLHIDEKLTELKSEDYLFEFFNDLFKMVNGEYGFIKNADGNNLMDKGKLVTT
jgi:hypothetical protein